MEEEKKRGESRRRWERGVSGKRGRVLSLTEWVAVGAREVCRLRLIVLE